MNRIKIKLHSHAMMGLVMLCMLNSCCTNPPVSDSDEVLSFKPIHKGTLVKKVSISSVPFEMDFNWTDTSNGLHLNYIVFDFGRSKIKFKEDYFHYIKPTSKILLHNSDKFFTLGQIGANWGIIIDAENKIIGSGM